MNNNEYYKVIIKNIFNQNSKNEEVFAVLDNNKIREILTNKIIYLFKDNFDIDKFKNDNCELIGTSIRKSTVSEISLYLNFCPKYQIDSKIDSINKIKEGIAEELKSYKIKKLKK